MPLAKQLTDMLLQFSATGMEPVHAAIQMVTSGLDDIADAANAVSAGVQQTLEAAVSGPQIDVLSGAVQAALGLVTQVGAAQPALAEAAATTEVWSAQTVHLGNALDDTHGKLAAFIKQLHGGHTGKVAPLPEFWEALQRHFDTGHSSVRLLASAGGSNLGALTDKVHGFVSAGGQHSSMAEGLAARLGQLGGAIASRFQPQIDAVLQTIPKVVDWFRQLGEAQQANLAPTIEGAAAGLALALALTTLVPGIQAAASALNGLGQASSFAFGPSGLGGLGVKTDTIAAGLSVLTARTQQSRAELSSLGDAPKPLLSALQKMKGAVQRRMQTPGMKTIDPFPQGQASPLPQQMGELGKQINLPTGPTSHPGTPAGQAPGSAGKPGHGAGRSGHGSAGHGKHGGGMPHLLGFQAPEAAYFRIAEASRMLGAGKPVEQQQLDQLHQIQSNTQQTNQLLSRHGPSLVKP